MRCELKILMHQTPMGGNAADVQVPKHTEKAREHATPPVGQSESESSPRGAACENDDECDDVFYDAMTIDDPANGVALKGSLGGSLDSPQSSRAPAMSAIWMTAIERSDDPMAVDPTARESVVGQESQNAWGRGKKTHASGAAAHTLSLPFLRCSLHSRPGPLLITFVAGDLTPQF